MSRQKIFGSEFHIKYPDPCIAEYCTKGSMYKSLDRVTRGDFVRDVQTEHPYPITKDYVESFASAADYKSNLFDSLNAPPRGSYGDFTALQEACQMNPDALDDFKAYIAEKVRLKNEKIGAEELQGDEENDRKL